MLRWMIGAKRNGNSNPCPVAEALDAQRMGRDVHQHGADVGAGDDRCLNGRAHRHAQIGIDLLMRRLTEPLLQQPADTSGVRVLPPTSTTLSIAEPVSVRIVESPLDAIHRAVKQRPNHLFVFLAGQFPG